LTKILVFALIIFLSYVIFTSDGRDNFFDFIKMVESVGGEELVKPSNDVIEELVEPSNDVAEEL